MFQFYRPSSAKLALILSISVIPTRILVCAIFCKKLFFTDQIVCSYLLDDRIMRFASKCLQLLMCQGFLTHQGLCCTYVKDEIHMMICLALCCIQLFFCVCYDLVSSQLMLVIYVSCDSSCGGHGSLMRFRFVIPWRGFLTHAGPRQSRLHVVCVCARGWGGVLLPLR